MIEVFVEFIAISDCSDAGYAGMSIFTTVYDDNWYIVNTSVLRNLLYTKEGFSVPYINLSEEELLIALMSGSVLKTQEYWAERNMVFNIIKNIGAKIINE